VLTMRGAPQIYYGTEILMANPGTEDHGTIRSDFPGGWAGDHVNAFTGEGLNEQQREAQAFLKTLLTWRRDKDVIHSGQLTHFRPENGTYVYFRHDVDESVMVVLNKNAEDTELDLSRFSERLKGYQKALDVISGKTIQLGNTLKLPARSVLVLELRQ
jgi:glycosidase